MKPRLVIVIGMPGSGKTAYLNQLLKNKEVVGFYDDYQGDSHDHQKDPRLSKFYSPMLARLKLGETVAVSDIRYCNHAELNKLVAAVLDVIPETVLGYRYFENDPTACKENIKKRARQEKLELELKLIDEFSPNYSIPETRVLKVYKA